MEKLSILIVDAIRPALDPDDEATNVHGQPNAYHNYGAHINFDRFFYAAHKAQSGSTAYEADCNAKSVALLAHDPDCIERNTGWAVDAWTKAAKLAKIADAIGVQFEEAYFELFKATFDVDAYEARFNNGNGSTPKKPTKERKAAIAALLAN